MRASSCCHCLANRRNRVFSHQLVGRAKVRHRNGLPSGDLGYVRTSEGLLRRASDRETGRLEVWRLLT